ncbi:hypothetical protein [Nautilia lithotrophica]
MLINTLNKTIQTLNDLISITKEDIDNIKQANHEKVFANTEKKEKLAYEFSSLKNEIDKILVSRNKPLEEIFSSEEEKLFNEFREKLFEFNNLHKRFSKLALSVANFYNTLVNQIHNNEPINYNNESFKNSNLHLKA